MSTFPPSVPSKKRNHDEAAETDDENEKSLLVLTSRASVEHPEFLRSKLSDEDEDRIITRKMELRRRQLEELEGEEHDFMAQRHHAIGEVIAGAAEGLALAEEPDRYCRKCNNLFQGRETNSCTVVGCQSHKECQACQVSDTGFPSTDDSESNGDEGYGSALLYNDAPYLDYGCFEQNDFPSDSGYIKCWICQEIVCNQHFANSHYHECRQKVSNNCGFRPPGDDNPGCVCVAGHCGRKLTKTDRFYVCYEGDVICDALCCQDCGVVCTNETEDDYAAASWNPTYDDLGYGNECGNVMCKKCAQNQCYKCAF